MSRIFILPRPAYLTINNRLNMAYNNQDPEKKQHGTHAGAYLPYHTATQSLSNLYCGYGEADVGEDVCVPV